MLKQRLPENRSGNAEGPVAKAGPFPVWNLVAEHFLNGTI